MILHWEDRAPVVSYGSPGPEQLEVVSAVRCEGFYMSPGTVVAKLDDTPQMHTTAIQSKYGKVVSVDVCLPVSASFLLFAI